MDKTTAKPTDFSQLILKLRNEYAQLKERVGSLHSFLCDIDFEKRVPDPVEQRLMREQMSAMLRYMDNLRERVSCKERQLTTDKWLKMQQPKAIVETLCGPVRVTNVDESINMEQFLRQHGIEKPCGIAPEPHHCVHGVKEFNPVLDEQHHCGCDCCKEDDGNADVSEQAHTGIKNLEGMQVVKFVRNVNTRCDTCPLEHYGAQCQKVELVGGSFLCLAPLPISITQ